MIKYEDVYTWKVLDEIKNGETIYVINKALYGRSDAIETANTMKTGELMRIINDDNSNKQYEFYKLVKRSGKTNE